MDAMNRQRILLGVKREGTRVGVLWTSFAGGDLDPTTAATVGGVETPMSGTLQALVYQVSGSVALRKFAELQVGDMILDLAPDALVTVGDGSGPSGTLALDSLRELGVRFALPNGQLYTQADVGEELAAAWQTWAGGVPVLRTMVLRKAT